MNRFPFLSGLCNEEGGSVAEYSLLIGIVIIGVVTAVTTLGTRIVNAISNVSNIFNSM